MAVFLVMAMMAVSPSDDSISCVFSDCSVLVMMVFQLMGES